MKFELSFTNKEVTPWGRDSVFEANDRQNMLSRTN
jgi:hypothetical protein